MNTTEEEIVHEFLTENQPMIQAMAHLNKCLHGEITPELPPEYLALPQEEKDKIDRIVKRMFQGE